MKTAFIRPLVHCSLGLALILAGALVVSLMWDRAPVNPPVAPVAPPTTEGVTVSRTELPDPPPAPKKVANPDRVRTTLRPGKTYATHTRGTLHVRGEDRAWGLGSVVTINYAFEAFIDRDIESNDGARVVELRHFRSVRSLKVDARLEDLRIDLGGAGGLFAGLAALAAFQPDAGAAAAAIKSVDGASLLPALRALRWVGVSPEQLSGLNSQVAKVVTKVEALSGKKVRITFSDGQGVLNVQAVKGHMTAEERDLHFASSVLSDALIVPDADIRIGSRWGVDGGNFANLIDPALLARTGGEVTLTRAPDSLVEGKVCRQLHVVAGRLTLDGSDRDTGRLGHFDPEGALDFSPEDQVVIRAVLKGKASLERFSKDHLLFETRMRRHPEMEVRFACEVADTLKGK